MRARSACTQQHTESVLLGHARKLHPAHPARHVELHLERHPVLERREVGLRLYHRDISLVRKHEEQ